MQIGKYKVSEFQTGTFGLDGGAMFGVVPKPLWEKQIHSDDRNRIQLGARSLLLESGTRKIIVDTGIGHSYDEKFSSIYDIADRYSDFVSLLKPFGVHPDEITDIILTHLHFDHTGGAVIREGNKYIPAFPNAKYHVQKKQYYWAANPSDKDKGSFYRNRFVPLYEEGVLELGEGNIQLDDEIELVTTNGHTIDQQLVKISDGEKTLLFCADLIPTFAHIPMPYLMSFDLQPLVTLKEKEEIYKKAIAENWLLFFEHDTKTACGTVMKSDKGYKLDKQWSTLNDADT